MSDLSFQMSFSITYKYRPYMYYILQEGIYYENVDENRNLLVRMADAYFGIRSTKRSKDDFTLSDIKSPVNAAGW